MLGSWPRRNILGLATVTSAIRALGLAIPKRDLALAGEINDLTVPDLFPTQPMELVREMVTVSHFDLKRVKQLVEARPSLARASWDWGFGDWETALGAASHMGNRPIAEYLVSKGARPSLFSASMLGHLDVVKAFVSAQPGVQRIRGPHDISLVAHARMGGEAARPVLEFLTALGDADADPPVPLADAEAARLVGTYVFGLGANQRVEVTSDMKMYAGSKMYTHPPQLNWTRTGSMTRPLFHVGQSTFYPAGAPSVRIRFTEERETILMAVTDERLVLTASRKLESR